MLFFGLTRAHQGRAVIKYSSFFIWLKTIGLSSMIAIGIALFFIRSHKMGPPIGHKPYIEAKSSSPRIYADQYLLLVSETNADEIKTILEPLALKVEMPILNWLLVSSDPHGVHEIVSLESEQASPSRLTLSSLLKHPHVLDAQHNYVLDGMELPSNWSFNDDWQFKKSSPENDDYGMGLSDAFSITEGSPEFSIAVVDRFTSRGQFTFLRRFSACCERVSFLAPFSHMDRERAEDPLPHGENMLLALGACIDAQPFSAGIDRHAKILAVQRPSSGHAESFLAALAASNIDACQESIVPCPPNTSSVLPEKAPDVLLLPFGNNAPELLQFSSDMLEAINHKGVIIVTSAGNDGGDAGNSFPGGNLNVINVGAIDHTGQRASFSNFGPTVDLLAPGDDIEIRYPNGIKKVSGTSIAAAYVAGGVLLMKSVRPSLNQRSADLLLKRSALTISCEQYCPEEDEDGNGCRAICCNGDDNICNKASLDIGRAVRLARDLNILPPILGLDKRYLLYLRNDLGDKHVVVKNLGDMTAKVKALSFDDNLKVLPQEFFLKGAKEPHSEQTLSISFNREPFTRQTFKIELVASSRDEVTDRAEFYLEYIPKD